MVGHAGVDGYSCTVFLHCSNNNRASTVLDLFQSAVAEWGLPSQVRCDKGGENTHGLVHAVTSKTKYMKGICDCWQECTQSKDRKSLEGCISRSFVDVFWFVSPHGRGWTA